jgi:heme exporter protein A
VPLTDGDSPFLNHGGVSPEEAEGQRRVTPERRSPNGFDAASHPIPLGARRRPTFPGNWISLAAHVSVAARFGAGSDQLDAIIVGLFQGHALGCRRGEALIFEAVDFALAPGDALWLSGPNGSGKSSLLRLMAGLLAPVQGAIAWDGTPIDDDREAHRARLRYLGHLDAVKTHLTVAENLSFWAAYWDIAESAVGPALARLGIPHLATAPARQLSAGQRRRSALARLALGPAPLWLLDEPSAALDTDGIERLAGLIAEARAAGSIVIFSSHDSLPVPGMKQLALAA